MSSAATDTSEALRAAILSGALAENGRLLPERALAERLAISRNRLRAVLEDLVREGLVFRRQGQGTFLQPPPAQAPERLGALARRVSPRDLMEVRLELEPALAARAAQYGRPADKALLRRLLEDTLRAPDLAAYERADDIFHYKIAEMARNPVFLSLFEEIRSLRQAAEWTRARQHALGGAEIAEISQQHSAIAAAIGSGDAEAARAAMRQHMLSVGKLLSVRPAP